jgi:hypothetical protein
MNTHSGDSVSRRLRAFLTFFQKAFLCSSLERLSVAVDSFWFTCIFLAFLQKGLFCGTRKRLAVRTDRLALAGLLGKCRSDSEDHQKSRYEDSSHVRSPRDAPQRFHWYHAAARSDSLGGVMLHDERECCAAVATVAIAFANPSPAPTNDHVANPTPDPAEPPIIEIQGNNPAHLNVGDSYIDLGARITGPKQADTNLGLHLFLDGSAVPSITLDTQDPGKHTIDYVPENTAGTSTSTRTVIIDAPQPQTPPPSAAPSANATSITTASTTASTTQ